MHVHAKPMRQCMPEKLIAGTSPAKVCRVLLHVVARELVELLQRGARLHSCNRGFLRSEHQVVERALPWRKLAVNGDRTRDIASVVSVFGAHVHNNQIACACATSALVVMQHCRVGAGTYDSRKADAFSPRA